MRRSQDRSSEQSFDPSLLPSSQVLLKGFGVHLRDMCPRKWGQQSLEDFVTISDRQVSMLVQEVLCQAPPIWLDHAEEHFLNNLDFFKPIQVKTHLLTGLRSHDRFNNRPSTPTTITRKQPITVL